MTPFVASWLPQLSPETLRDASPADAKRWAIRAEDQIHALVGRGVVEESARFVGRLVAAGHLDEQTWRDRLVNAAIKAGHRNAEARVDAGMNPGASRRKGSRRSVVDGSNPSALPKPRALLRAWRDGRLPDADVQALVEARLHAIRETRNEESDWLAGFARRSHAIFQAAKLAGMLYALGITDDWSRRAVLDAAGAAHPRQQGYEASVDRGVCCGIADVWDDIIVPDNAAGLNATMLRERLQRSGWS